MHQYIHVLILSLGVATVACSAKTFGPDILNKTNDMTPEQVKQALPSLLAELPPGKSVASKRDRAELDLLAKVALVRNSKCTTKYFEDINFLKEGVSRFPSMVKYLNYYEEEQLKTCENYLKDKVESLDAETREFASDMRSIFVKLNALFELQQSADELLEVAPETINAGIRQYIDEKVLPIGQYAHDSYARGLKEMSQQVRRVQHNCNILTNAIKPTIEVFSSLGDDLKSQGVSAFVRDWLVTASICAQIQGNSRKIAESILDDYSGSESE